MKIKNKISYSKAINDALHQKMQKDKNLVVFGLDVEDHMVRKDFLAHHYLKTQ